jgi:Leucine-rich repeat (LRR) protein
MFPDVHYCHSLKRLDLSTNFIRKVREEDLEGLKELKEMILSENP